MGASGNDKVDISDDDADARMTWCWLVPSNPFVDKEFDYRYV